MLTYLDLWSGVHWLLISGHDADVEQPRKDEDQTGSSGRSWTHRGGSFQFEVRLVSQADKSFMTIGLV